jgi:hypothetical protein
MSHSGGSRSSVTEVPDPLALGVLNRRFHDGDYATVAVRDGRLVLERGTPASSPAPPAHLRGEA